MGWEQEAEMINAKCKEFKIQHAMDAWKMFYKALKPFQVKLQLTKLDNFDLLKTDRIEWPVIASLVGSDNSENHAVAFCHGYVFDTNLKTAVCRGKEILDWCCSTDTEDFKFKKLGKVYQISALLEYKKKQRRKMAKKEQKEKRSAEIGEKEESDGDALSEDSKSDESMGVSERDELRAQEVQDRRPLPPPLLPPLPSLPPPPLP